MMLCVKPGMFSHANDVTEIFLAILPAAVNTIRLAFLTQLAELFI